jgi:hypothetical protein
MTVSIDSICLYFPTEMMSFLTFAQRNSLYSVERYIISWYDCKYEIQIPK